ncbi:HI0933-like protein [Aureococcus anophagefferens]|nr:HI0933-like protein [Aureococcus anophagefferens]
MGGGSSSAKYAAAEPGPGGVVGAVADDELAKRYDLVVVGGGPAGVAGALKGAYLGKRVLLVDRPKAPLDARGVDVAFGGPTGLFSKALRDTAKTLDIQALKAQGLDDEVVWLQVQKMCLQLARNNAETTVALLKKFRVGYQQGTATLLGDGKVRVDRVGGAGCVDVAGAKLLVCCGSVPMRVGGVPFDGRRVFDADSINTLGFLPKSVVIVGSGIIAIEYAMIFRKLGAASLKDEAVTIMEGTSVDAFLEPKADGSLRIKLKGDAGDLGRTRPALASTGVEQAQRAVSHAFGTAVESIDQFPVGVWTIPEVGFFGLTRAAAEKAGRTVKEGVAGYDMCLRGRVFAPDGLLKLVFDVESREILGVHIIGRDACELVHYGMDLVMKRATIFDVIGTLFTAVTFHELFKEAALDGNSKLDFGIQWQEVLMSLGTQLPAKDLLESGEVKRKFDAIDTDKSGGLDEAELLTVLNSFGQDVPAAVAANIIHLADEDGNGVIDIHEFEKIFHVLAAMEAAAGKDKK